MRNKNIDCRNPYEPVERGLDLFSKTDPETSKLAAEQAYSLVINHQNIIMSALSEEAAKKNNGMTSDEIAISTGFTLVQVARRMSELESRNIIYKTDMIRKTRTGRGSTVWRLVTIRKVLT